jgi:hypothetical protein
VNEGKGARYWKIVRKVLHDKQMSFDRDEAPSGAGAQL